MTIYFSNILRTLMIFGTALLLTVSAVRADVAKKTPEEIAKTIEQANLKLQLIWGTDEKVENNKFKEVSEDCKKKLSEFLKWKNYYQISARYVVANEKDQKIQMSKKCEVVISQTDDVVEATVYGEGKLVLKKKMKVTPQIPQSIGGKDEKGNAWVILISIPSEKDKQETLKNLLEKQKEKTKEKVQEKKEESTPAK